MKHLVLIIIFISYGLCQSATKPPSTTKSVPSSKIVSTPSTAKPLSSSKVTSTPSTAKPLTTTEFVSSTKDPCLDDNSTCTTDASTDKLVESTTEELSTTSEEEEDEDYDNSTMSSTESTVTGNTTVAVNTTLQPNITTVAPTLPTTTPEPVFPSKDLEAVPCTCDLLVEACDIGCCCDVDCSVEDRKVFSHCKDFRPPFPADPMLCHRAHWWYKENTAYGGMQYHGGLLCLHTDNLPDRHWLENPKVVTSEKQFEDALFRSPTIPWPNLHTSDELSLTPGSPYKSGNIIWTLKYNKTIVPFALTSSVLTSNCELQKNILYLENYHSKCNHILNEECTTKIGSINATYFYNDLQFLANKFEPIWNQTDPWLGVKPFICPLSSLEHKYPQNCSELMNFTSPALSEAGQQCENSVVKARYIILHNGTEGISSIKLYLWIDALPISTLVYQTLEVLFEWSDSQISPQQRSGRPGYVQSWPVRAGTLNFVKSSVLSLNITRGHSESWLTIPTSGPQGICDSTKRRTILFNENVLSHCKIVLSNANFTRSGCTNMSANIINMILGHQPANDIVIAAFGDSEWATLVDWVPIIFKDLPQEGKFSEIIIFNNENKTEKSSVIKAESDVIGYCGGISTSLSIQFLWTYVGSHASPQSKITGVLFNFGETNILDPPKTNHQTSINLITSISFVDVTPPVQAKFAPLPKYEIRLPRDFFYPLFSMSNSNVTSFSSHLVIFILILLFVFDI